MPIFGLWKQDKVAPQVIVVAVSQSALKSIVSKNDLLSSNSDGLTSTWGTTAGAYALFNCWVYRYEITRAGNEA